MMFNWKKATMIISLSAGISMLSLLATASPLDVDKVQEIPLYCPVGFIPVASTKTITPTTTKKTTTTKKGTIYMQTKYPVHSNIYTTMFWVGETESADNAYISNVPSAWAEDWVSMFGGVDDPKKRNGYFPAGFTPKENPFYFALPYGDYDQNGLKENLTKIYWYTPITSGKSLLKNRWIKVTYKGKTVYGQWEDVGPFLDNDVDYVFGTSAPKQKAALDLSPAMSDYLGTNGGAYTSWQFVEERDVPPGPWKQIVTKSSPNWN